MLIGDRRKFLSCFLTLKVEVDPDSLEPQSELSGPALEWCESVGSKAKTVQDIVNGRIEDIPQLVVGPVIFKHLLDRRLRRVVGHPVGHRPCQPKGDFKRTEGTEVADPFEGL